MKLVRIDRILGSVILTSLLGVAAQGQEIVGTDPATKPPIEVKLSTTSLMLCIGSSLPLDLELTNRGANQLKIDKVDIWSHFSYGFLSGRDTGRGGGLSIVCGHCRRDFVSLKSDQTYKSSTLFDLTKDFFTDEGKYSLKTTIEGVSSNELEFELFRCD